MFKKTTAIVFTLVMALAVSATAFANPLARTNVEPDFIPACFRIGGVVEMPTPMPMPTVPMLPEAIDGQTAYELFMLANDALIQAGSVLMETESVSTITMDLMGMFEEIEMRQVGTIAQVIRSETDMDLRMEMTTPTHAMGESIPMLSYFRDGTMYVYMMGEWVTMGISLTDIMAQTGLITFPEDAIERQSIEALADGSHILRFIMQGDAMTEVVDAALGALAGMLDGVDMQMQIGDILVASTVDADGNMLDMYMEMLMTIEVEGMSVIMLSEMHSTVVQLGGVNIDFPEELDNL